MKFATAIILLSSLYIATALSNTPWVPIRRGLANNNPFGSDLDAIGGQNNLGQAFDSGVFNNTDGEVTNTYDSWFQSGANAAFNYSSELQLSFADDTTENSRYAIRIDPETGRRDIIWWSLEQLKGGDNNGPAGRNITYDADTDTVTVTSFEGVEQWVLYQLGQPINDTGLDNVVNLTVDTYDSFNAYLTDFIGYEEQNTETYVNDDGLTNAVNNAVAQVGDAAGLANTRLTELRNLHTYVGPDENLWVRVNADIESDTDSGEIVGVILCDGGSDCSDSAIQYWWWNSVLFA